MENKLIKTNTIWFKIKNFFKKIFKRKKNNEAIEITDNTPKNTMTLREKIGEYSRKKELAEKLLNNEIDVYDLTDEEVEEMTEYFVKDIEQLDTEINRVKIHIEAMKKQINLV